MRIKICINLWIACLLFAGATISQASEQIEMDGRTLQSLCAEYHEATLKGELPKETVMPYMRCMHYMQGVVEASIFYERMMYTVSGNHIFCFPKRVISTAQAILLVNEYLKKHPEKLDRKGVVLVMEAFLEAYSCNK